MLYESIIGVEKKTNYINSLLSNKKYLNKASKDFIDALFENAGDNYQYFSDSLEEKLKKQYAHVEVKNLDEIFPEEIYPALDLLMGQENRVRFIYCCKYLPNLPYTSGYYRHMLRSDNYVNYLDKIFTIFGHNIYTYILGINVIDLIKRNYNLEYGYRINSSISYTYEINKGNQEVIDTIKDIILSDRNTNILTYQILEGIIMSNNDELNDLVCKLLLAAKLQEGLRQSICESMDSGLNKNFVKLFNIVHENNMIRFASVRRAVATFTGIGEYESDRITSKEMDIIYDLINGNVSSTELIDSGDNVKLLLGLWFEGSIDVTRKIDAINRILENPQLHSILALSYAMNDIKIPDYTRNIAKDVFKKFLCSKTEFSNDDLKIYACYEKYIFGYVYNFTDNLVKKKITLSDFFENTKEAITIFELYKNISDSLPKKEQKFDPCIFPWHSVTISKSTLSRDMGYIVALVGSQDIKDIYVEYLDSSYYTRDLLEFLYSKPNSEKQKTSLVKILGIRNFDTNAVLKIIKNNGFACEYIKEIEGYLRLKTPEIRQACVELLYLQDTKDLQISISKLLADKNENNRLGGLELLLKAKNDEKIDISTIKSLLELNTAPTTSEQVLLEEIMGSNTENLLENLYDKTYTPNLIFDIKPRLNAKKIFSLSSKQIIKILRALSALYSEHENYEYSSIFTEKVTLSNYFVEVKTDKQNDDKTPLDRYPLPEVWRTFYNEHIGSFTNLLQIYLILEEENNRYAEKNPFIDLLDKTLNMNITKVIKTLKKENLAYFGNTWRTNQGKKVLEALFNELRESHKDEYYEIAFSILATLETKFSVEKLVYEDEDWRKEKYYEDILSNSFLISTMLKALNTYSNDEQFIESFKLKYFITNKRKALSNKTGIKNNCSILDVHEVAYGIHLGLLSQDALYQSILENIDTAKEYISTISDYLINNKLIQRYYYDRIPTHALNDNTIALLKIHGKKIIDALVAMELKRADTPLEYSKAIHSIRRVEGIDILIAILKALGNLKLDRNSWYWGGGAAKQETLSRLLKVSYPTENDNATVLSKALENTNITNQRLVEVAMYAPQWVPILEEHLGWKGMASGCYYFQAHTSDIDKTKENIFSTYTPISLEDLENGAFDVDWFKSAYAELGEENFNLLYESAKYISDGAKHSRARKFADATLGKYKISEVEKEISAKRNQDLVKSYTLIPLTKDKEKDILHRYKFLQQFLKESKKFGAQRRTSEANSVKLALENLSRNAGYEDVTRLTWTVETNLIKEISHFFTPTLVGDINVSIFIDETGKSEIVYEKEGKKLKSLPAKYKKDTYIEEVKQAHKNLKDQHSRSKKMLEESMENSTVFYVKEINNLLENNPVIAPLLRNLVMKTDSNIGYFENNTLCSFMEKNGQIIQEKHDLKPEDELVIAHPFDLYKDGKWHIYQKDLFERQIIQPFKQVFRQLYVKTADELDKTHSLRYAGNQIQAQRTVGLLKGRHWVIDAEEGLQKVYYKENIIVKIYALADWFSPGEIEAPTLEWVCFYDRKTGKEKNINDIPDIIFSEVMRDIDLVISVAHVGGVDPLTSHSTIEMRKVIAQFNVELFKLNNVTFTDNHAIIEGSRANYTIHLGSGLVHQKAGSVINVLPVHSQKRGKLFLPFVDEDPKTAEIMSKILLFSQDEKIKDPNILEQISHNK